MPCCCGPCRFTIRGGSCFSSGSNPLQPGAGIPFSVAAYEGVRDGNSAFTGVTAFCGEGLTLTGAGDPVQLSGLRVSPNFFDVLGVQPAAGRAFRPAEGEPGGEPVALISQGLWERRFASDPRLLGKSITLAQTPYTVIGIAPRDFTIPYEDVDVWVSRISLFGGLTQDQIRNGGGFLMGIARLKPGVTATQADAEVAVAQPAVSRAASQEPGRRPEGPPLCHAAAGDPRHRNPLDASDSGRRGRARAADRVRQCREPHTGARHRAREGDCRARRAGRRAWRHRRPTADRESAAGGGGRGLRNLLAALGRLAAERVGRPPAFPTASMWICRCSPSASDFHCSPASLFGLTPALQASRPDLNGVLRDSGWGTTGGARRHRTRSLLVAGQIALSVVLLIAAGLFVESFRQLQRVKPGFDPSHALTMRISLPAARYSDDGRRTQFVRADAGAHRGAAGCAVRSGVAGYSDEHRSGRAIPGRRSAADAALAAAARRVEGDHARLFPDDGSSRSFAAARSPGPTMTVRRGV